MALMGFGTVWALLASGSSDFVAVRANRAPLFGGVFLAVIIVTAAANAQTFERFHSGVNLSVAPGGANQSAAPLDAQQTENAQRVDEAADIGFDFVRLRVALAPWTTGNTQLPRQ
jgi:hypothetical protein